MYQVKEGALVMVGLDVASAPLLTTAVRPIWASVRATRAAVGQALANYPRGFVQATMMAASELLENAIKYGEDVPGAPEILLTLSIRDERVVLQTVNGSTDQELVNSLREHVRRVCEEPDLGALYLARLEQLLMRAGADSGLGLYRIAFEGEFDLACRCESDIVTVTATRRLP